MEIFFDVEKYRLRQEKSLKELTDYLLRSDPEDLTPEEGQTSTSFLAKIIKIKLQGKGLSFYDPVKDEIVLCPPLLFKEAQENIKLFNDPVENFIYTFTYAVTEEAIHQTLRRLLTEPQDKFKGYLISFQFDNISPKSKNLILTAFYREQNSF